MADVVMFGGTTEGRLIAERFGRIFARTATRLLVCVATEYGAGLIKQTKNVSVHVGRLDAAKMKQFLEDSGATLCIDATHPYATDVTANISAVCEELGIASVRVVREQLGDNKDGILTAGCEDIMTVNVDSVEEAVRYLEKTEGNIFIATGSKELEKFTEIKNYRERCTARVLSTAEVVEHCAKLGFEGRNLIAMQGPFSEDINYEMLKLTGAKWLVTKNSGREGGYIEKCEACIRAGVNIVIIGRPKEKGTNLVEVEECIDIIVRIYKSR